MYTTVTYLQCFSNVSSWHFRSNTPAVFEVWLWEKHPTPFTV